MYDPLSALLIAVLIAMMLLVLFWPQRGLLPRWRQGRRMTQRVRGEDALKHVFNYEVEGQSASIASIAGTLNMTLAEATDLVVTMERDGLLQTSQGQIMLTDAGRESALHIIRAHRLWERYLAEETGFASQTWHEHADRWEHTISPDAADALSAQLGYPKYDPHGDPIPGAGGELQPPTGEPLAAVPAGRSARIVHMEDEPEIVYAQLLAEGLHLGQILRVTESSAKRIRFWTNGDEHLLAPIVAANITVVPLEKLEDSAPVLRDSLSLTTLEPGEMAEVVAISPASRGKERRRLLDLGILPGSRITAEFNSPSGNPTAYKIRGAVIALRAEQAEHIRIKKCAESIP